MNPGRAADFVLVHGIAHGAWCWELLEPELARLGHRTLTVDLPVDDPAAGLDDYADAVLAAMDGNVGADAVLVGHSMGGVVIPRVALRRPVRRMVYLCSLPPPVNAVEQRRVPRSDPDKFGWRVIDDQGRLGLSPRLAAEHFYPDCPPDVAERAVARLRPQSHRPITDPQLLPQRPDVESDTIFCTEDSVITPAFHALAEDWFGKSPYLLPGSHSPFLSRPGDLAAILAEIVGGTGQATADEVRYPAS